MDNIEEYRKDQSKLYKKKSKLRELVLKCDWKKDGFMLLGGKRVEYITSEKVIRNFAPLLPQVGLEIITTFGEPKRLDPFGSRAEEHWLASYTVQYVDIDTGACTCPATYYGEAMDSRDKALKKANTDAMKTWLVADFKIGEGIDPELSGGEGTFSPKSEEENVEIKTQIAGMAVKPKVPVPKPIEVPSPPAAERPKVEAPKEEPKAEEPKEEPEPEKPKKPRAPRKKAEEPAPEVPKEEPKPAESNNIAPGMDTEYGAKITEAQKKPLFSAFGKWISAHNGGTISDKKFEEVKATYRNIGSNADVIRFIAMSREIKE